MEAAAIRRARSLVFQAEDALDLAVIALDSGPVSDCQRTEIRADVNTVQIKAAALAHKLADPGQAWARGAS